MESVSFAFNSARSNALTFTCCNFITSKILSYGEKELIIWRLKSVKQRATNKIKKNETNLFHKYKNSPKMQQKLTSQTLTMQWYIITLIWHVTKTVASWTAVIRYLPYIRGSKKRQATIRCNWNRDNEICWP